MSKLRVGIIGTGVHGARYARHVLQDPVGMELTAIARRSEAGGEQARRWNCRWHADWRALVDDEGVEAVISAATPDLNADIAEACARADKPLLLEKPLAADLRSGERVCAAAQRAPLTVAQTLRYNPVILALKRELPRAGRLFSFAADQRLEPSAHAWLTDPAVAGGGVVLHTAVHLFDALRFITGREILAVRGTSLRRHNPRLEDLFLGELRMEGELHGTVDLSKVGPARTGRYAFTGSEGMLEGEQVHGELRWVCGRRLEQLEAHAPLPTLPSLLRDWGGFLRGERGNPIPAEEGLAALRACVAALRSLDEGWVRP